MSKFIDITGQKFGRLTVLEYVPGYQTKNNKIIPSWKCICDCQINKQSEDIKYTYARSIDLRNGNVVSCGCYHQELRHTVKIKPANRAEDLIGQKFGFLTVIKRGENDKHNKARWWCQCDCGNPDLVLINALRLKSGGTKSCGCLQKDFAKKLCKNRAILNKYDLSGEYGIGYCENLNQDGTHEFWFDKEDYDKIKDYHWVFGSKFSVQTKVNNTTLLLHRLIMEVTEFETQVDHIKHIRYDNRKSQLRIVNNSQNGMNNGIQCNNKTGITGVYYNNKNGKYMAYITVNNEQIYLGYYNTKEEAGEVRKNAEEKYFGEYSYDNSMKLNNKESD